MSAGNLKGTITLPWVVAIVFGVVILFSMIHKDNKVKAVDKVMTQTDDILVSIQSADKDHFGERLASGVNRLDAISLDDCPREFQVAHKNYVNNIRTVSDAFDTYQKSSIFSRSDASTQMDDAGEKLKNSRAQLESAAKSVRTASPSPF